MAPPTVMRLQPNMAWAMDFRVDVTIVGWPIKIVAVVDAYTRE